MADRCPLFLTVPSSVPLPSTLPSAATNLGSLPSANTTISFHSLDPPHAHFVRHPSYQPQQASPNHTTPSGLDHVAAAASSVSAAGQTAAKVNPSASSFIRFPSAEAFSTGDSPFDTSDLPAPSAPTSLPHKRYE